MHIADIADASKKPSLGGAAAPDVSAAAGRNSGAFGWKHRGIPVSISLFPWLVNHATLSNAASSSCSVSRYDPSSVYAMLRARFPEKLVLSSTLVFASRMSAPASKLVATGEPG